MSKRFERIEREPFRLTERDCGTLQALFEARYLTNRMICQLMYKPTTFSWCKQRLRYLFDMGYVKKRKVHINEPDIYFLGLRGKRYIASLGGCSQQEVERIAGVSGGVAEAPVLMMGHDLTLSSLYVDAVLECRRNGWEMHWENSRMLEMRNLGVQPDAYLRVAGKGVNQQAFLELTAVPPTKVEMRDKLEGYRPLLEQVGGCPILWLTTSRGKLEYLKREVAEWLYHDYVLLGLAEEKSGFLTKPMWHWSEGEELVRFIRPNKVVVYRAGGQPDP